MNWLPLSANGPSTDPKETVVAVDPPEPRKSSYSNRPNGIGPAAGRRSGAWAFGVSALVVGGAAVIGSIFWLGQIKSEPSKAPPSIAEARGQPKVQPRGIPSVATSSGAEAAAPRDGAQPAESKAAGPEERTTNLIAHALPENPPLSQDLGPAAIGGAQPTGPTAATPSATAPVNTPAPAGPVASAPPPAPANPPAPAAPVAAPAPAASQSLDSKAAPAVSLPPAPAPTATLTTSATGSGVAARASEAPLPPVRPAPKPASQAGAATQRSTAKLELPVKLSSQSGAHVVAKTGAAAAAPETKTPLKPAQASAEPQAAPSQQPAPAPQQPNPNPVARAFGTVAGAVGAVAGLIPFVPH